MNDFTQHDPTVRLLSCGVVLRVREDECDVTRDGLLLTARFASMFPSPRTERVQPGHLVAMTPGSDGVETVVWRWFDAVVVDDGLDTVKLWEPSYGEVSAQARPAYTAGKLGVRAYVSAGLLGAEWWVAGPVTENGRDADVELSEVDRLFAENGLWDSLD